MLLMLASMASAQSRTDAGDYQILQARYGTARHDIDVTARLKELASQDRTFQLQNSTFGTDPDPGQVKTLRIFARDRNGNTRTFEYAEKSVVDGSRFVGWAGGNRATDGADGQGRAEQDNGEAFGRSGPILKDRRPGRSGAVDDGEYQILQARYGTSQRNIDVTERLKELARQDRNFRLQNSTFGTDPDPGHVKTLRIYARDRSGRNRTFEYAEKSVVDGSQFTGWGDGNWGAGGRNGGWGGNRPDNAYRPDANVASLRIISARYGSGRDTRDVTSRVRGLVREGRLLIAVNNDAMGGDPAPHQPKVLQLTYSLDGGRQQQMSVREGDRLQLP